MRLLAYTDYPFTELGDPPVRPASVREVEILAYDRDKYCDITYAGKRLSVKAGYLFHGHPSEGNVIPRYMLSNLPPRLNLPLIGVFGGEMANEESGQAVREMIAIIARTMQLKTSVTLRVLGQNRFAFHPRSERGGVSIFMLYGIMGHVGLLPIGCADDAESAFGVARQFEFRRLQQQERRGVKKRDARYARYTPETDHDR